MSRATGVSRPIGSSSLLTSAKLTKTSKAIDRQVDMDQERSEIVVRDMLTSKRKDSPIQRGFNADVLLGTREID